MPHASDLHGRYVPHNTNKVPQNDESSLLNETESSHRSAASSQKIETNVDQLQHIPDKKNIVVTSSQGFWTTRKIIILISIIVVLVAVGAAVAIVLVLRQSTSSTSTSSSTITTPIYTGSNTTVTTATTTSTTTAVPNPCAGNNLRWSTTGTTVLSSSQLTNAHSLYIDSTNTLYVVDEYTNSVVWKLLYNATTATVVAGTAGSRGSSSLQLNYPQDAYMDRNGNLYVTDYYNYRVQKYANGSLNGTTIAGVTGTTGAGLSYFSGLRHFVFDPTETYMYVTDCDGYRIMRYLTNSTSGTNGVLVAGGNGAGNGNTTLYYPWGIHYLPSVSSDLFITNYYGHSVIRWTPGATSGYFVAGVPGTSGQSPILLNYPTDIKIDIYLNIYVADSYNNRIQMFCANSQTGITVAGTGVAGNSATQLNSPRAVIFDSSMNMYVGDDSNARVQKFAKL